MLSKKEIEESINYKHFTEVTSFRFSSRRKLKNLRVLIKVLREQLILFNTNIVKIFSIHILIV